MEDQEKTVLSENDEASQAERRVASRLAAMESTPDPKEVSKVLEQKEAEPIQSVLPQSGDLMDMVKADLDGNRGDVSASTIGRMLGLVTGSDFRILEGKVDLLATRLNSIILKLEKANTILMGAPSGSDLERIDVQIGSLRTMIREMVEDMEYAKEASSPLARKSKMRIKTSTKPEAEEEAAAPQPVEEAAPAVEGEAVVPAVEEEEKSEVDAGTADPVEE